MQGFRLAIALALLVTAASSAHAANITETDWGATADGRKSHAEMVAVLPNVGHTIASDYRSVLSIVIEPESVCPGVLEDPDPPADGLVGRPDPRWIPPVRGRLS